MMRRRWQARRIQASLRGEVGSSRGRAIAGWTAAAAALVVLAFIVGRPSAEQEVLSSTPPPTEAPLAITFGTSLDPVRGVAMGSTNRFRGGDPFAYSVTLPDAPGTDTILVEVARIGVSGRSVVQEPSVQHIVPSSPTFAFEVRTDDLLAAWGDGTFEMRIFLDAGTNPLAAGTFVLIADPAG